MSSISSEEEFQKKAPGKCQPCLAIKDVLKLFRKKEAAPMANAVPASSCCTSSGCTATLKAEAAAPIAPVEVVLEKVKEEQEVEPPSTAASPAAASPASLSVELAAAAAAPLSEETVPPAGDDVLSQNASQPVFEACPEDLLNFPTGTVTYVQEAAPVQAEQSVREPRQPRLTQAPGMKSPSFPVGGQITTSPRPAAVTRPVPVVQSTPGRTRVQSIGGSQPIYRPPVTSYASTTTRPSYSTQPSQATSPSLRAMAGQQVAAAQPVRTVYRPQQRPVTGSMTKLA